MSEFEFVPGDVITWTGDLQQGGDPYPLTVTAVGDMFFLANNGQGDEDTYLKSPRRSVRGEQTEWVRYVKPEDPMITAIDCVLSWYFNLSVALPGGKTPDNEVERIEIARSIAKSLHDMGL